MLPSIFLYSSPSAGQHATVPAWEYRWRVSCSFLAYAVDGMGEVHCPGATVAGALSLTGTGALAINLGCALMLARVRHHSGSLSKAAFLSARNDAIANVAHHRRRVVTATRCPRGLTLSWDLVYAAMNADAAREVWKAGREEHRAAEAAVP
jgi:hypothetical protein